MRAQHSPANRSLRRAGLWLLALTVLFILYASLYPFEFDLDRLRGVDAASLRRMFNSRRIPRSDLIANLIFYLPLGALLASLAPRPWTVARRALFALAVGAALSLVVETLQFATRSRDPAISDIALNALSALLGAGAALSAHGLGVRPALPELRAPRPDLPALVLIALWLGFHAAPFMPSARFVRYFHAPELLLAHDWTLAGAAGFFAGYLILAAALRSLLRPASFWPMLAASVAVSLASRIVFRAQQLQLDELLGCAAALPIVWRMHYDAEARAYLRATVCAGAALVFFALAPFVFVFVIGTPETHWFGTLPLTRRTAAGEPGILELVYISIGFVWLVGEAELPLRRVLPWLTAGVLLIEVVQAWQPGKSIHLAAPAAVLIGAVLLQSRRLFRQTSTA